MGRSEAKSMTTAAIGRTGAGIGDLHWMR
jgi:hypothetical protein